MKELCLTVVLCIPLFARAQSQLVLDTSSTQDNIIYGGAVATNGDRLMVLRSTEGLLLWRAQPDGTPVWTKQIGTGSMIGSPQIVADQANGCLQLRYLGTDQMDEDQSTMVDTMRLHYLLCSIDQGGTVNWSRKLSIDLRYTSSWPLFTVRLIAGVNGAFIVTHAKEALNPLTVIQFDDQGQMLWGRAYVPGDIGSFDEVGGITSDANGGLYITHSHLGPMWNYVLHLTPDGSMDWAKQFSYSNGTVYYNPTYDAVSLPDGSVQLLGRMDIPGHNYYSTVRISPSGSVTDAHFYPSSIVAWGAAITMDRRDDGGYLVALDSVLLAVAADGDVESAVALTSHVDDDQRNRFVPGTLAATPEGAVMSGVLDHVHVDLGYAHHRPAFRAVDPADPGCYTTPMAIGHVVVPPELYVVTDAAAFQEVALYATTMDTVINA